MRSVVFETEIFKTPRDRARGELALTLYLRTLFALDVQYLRDYPLTPNLYSSGVRYKAEPPGIEIWKDIPVVIRDRHGDCEDLACWLAAEYVVKRGIAAKPEWVLQPQTRVGFRLYHIIVRLPDGRTEDPSKFLGMRGNA